MKARRGTSTGGVDCVVLLDGIERALMEMKLGADAHGEQFATSSADGNRVPVIARLVQADEDTVRDLIHRLNEIGLACLDPRWAGGRPRLLSPDDEDFVVQTATTRPAKLGQPFTHWSIRKLLTYLGRLGAPVGGR